MLLLHGQAFAKINGTNRHITVIAENRPQEVPNLSEREVRLLERLVMAEAGGESLVGQIAVANVVLNRMQSSLFPDTLTEVVFQDGQFTPAMLGTLSQAVPTERVRFAVRSALRGVRAVDRRVLFFLNPRTATSRWIIRNRTFSERIENHDFYK